MNPFQTTRAGSAGEWGERRLIKAIRRWLGDASPPPPEGIGDDCAVFLPGAGSRILVTTDPILWGRHFDENSAPEEAASKLLKRNLSDIAAMGGRPRIAVISLLLPPSTSLEWLERFHHGLRESSLRYTVPISGGDISQTDGLLAACMTLIGETTAGRALTRAGAAAGDRLFVTGALGGSLLGHHLSFEPRLAEGQWLAARPEVTAAIDISDGLAKDLPSLLPANGEAELLAEAIPISESAKHMAEKSGRPRLFHALCDGEDYELLITVDGQSAARLLADWKNAFGTALTCIGTVAPRAPDSDEPLLRGLPTGLAEAVHGYEHLS